MRIFCLDTVGWEGGPGGGVEGRADLLLGRAAADEGVDIKGECNE
jgi:hypothetical protein